MLISIDEIGMNYYSNVNNDTQNSIIYHFNYWITLFTGVLDSLAWISKCCYQIEFGDLGRIGLRKNRQKEFLTLLYKKNPKIKDFLSKNSDIINLMYSPRDLVIHRSRLKGIRFNNVDENFDFNMVCIPGDFFNQISSISKENGEKISTWGHFKLDDEYFLEPYSFVKKATPEIINFANEFLENLDFDEYNRKNSCVI
jgi:hypothetical protein